MDTASGHRSRLAHQVGHISVVAVAAAVVGTLLLIGAIVLIADLLQPVSEPLIAAPLRWR